jgi:3'-phosphoadenosine 5'-phosphosulfate sulfotransferase (PAPS reductase)/FAD synthetase
MQLAKQFADYLKCLLTPKRTMMASLQEALASVSDPGVRHIVSLSGGKDSSALAVLMKQRYPDLPVEYVFCDTEYELPETYEYLDRLEAYLGKKIVRLNGLDTLRIARKPGRKAFDVWLKEYYGGFLPNPRSRWCTRVLKIKPFEEFIGNSTAYSYIGIRHDEKRDGYVAKKPVVISERPNITPCYPFKDLKMGLADIQNLLESTGLGFPGYYKWRSRSGCYFCFYQQRGEWARLRKNHPHLFESAQSFEKEEGGRRFTWVQGKELTEIADAADANDDPIIPADSGDGCAVCHL